MPDPRPVPAGFPKCRVCPFRASGPPEVCVVCVQATASLPALRCEICSRPLSPGETCWNKVCGWTYRYFGRVDAICQKTGPIDRQLRLFKYKREYLHWRLIFGRVLLGWLEANRSPDDYDIIIANPTHPSRVVRHTEIITRAASDEDVLDEWPFDVGPSRSLVKTAETTRSAKGNWPQKKAAADELETVLDVPDRSLIAGKRVLVIDDFTTTCLQLRAVAKVLRQCGGARAVDGLVFARTV